MVMNMSVQQEQIITLPSLEFSLGDRIRIARRQTKPHGIDQTELAARVQAVLEERRQQGAKPLNHQAIGRWERGSVIPNAYQAAAVAVACDISVSDLLDVPSRNRCFSHMPAMTGLPSMFDVDDLLTDWPSPTLAIVTDDSHTGILRPTQFA